LCQSGSENAASDSKGFQMLEAKEENLSVRHCTTLTRVLVVQVDIGKFTSVCDDVRHRRDVVTHTLPHLKCIA
jgi:hypothetical protein